MSNFLIAEPIPLTPEDLLKESGAFFMVLNSTSDFIMADPSYIFSIKTDDYFFLLGVNKGEIDYVRKGGGLALQIEEGDLSDLYPKIHLTIGWTPTTLFMSCMYFDRKNMIQFKEESVQTELIFPPPSLIEEAYRLNFINPKEFGSKYEFRNRCFSILNNIQDKINAFGIKAFWDYQKNKKGKILKRLPKNEHDILPIICQLINDMTKNSGLFVSYDHSTSFGKIDLLFLGKVKNSDMLSS